MSTRDLLIRAARANQGRPVPAVPPAGQPLGDAPARTARDPKFVAQVVAAVAAGGRPTAVAREFNVTIGVVTGILYRDRAKKKALDGGQEPDEARRGTAALPQPPDADPSAGKPTGAPALPGDRVEPSSSEGSA